MSIDLCTRCDQEEVMVPLKTGERLCAFCAEDWLDEMWEEYTPGDGGVEIDL